MKLILRYRVFIQEGQLCDFINDTNISKENIQCIAINENGHFILFYWG